MSRLPTAEEMLPDGISLRVWVNRYRSEGTSYDDPLMNVFDAYMEEHGWEVEDVPPTQPQSPTSRTNGLGLPKETISQHLCVTVLTQVKIDGKCKGEEVEKCAICLVEHKEKDKIGVIECGHQFHAECIKDWQRRNNACPLCRATVLIV